MEQAVLVATGAFLLFIAWQDFLTLKIRNPYVLIMIGLYVVYALVRWEPIQEDLIAGAVLFIMAFIFWLFGLVGAGDAKLYFPVGLFLSITGLVPYLVLLLVFSVVVLIVVRFGARMATGATLVGARLIELKEEGRIPYSVPMALATIVVMVLKQRLGL